MKNYISPIDLHHLSVQLGLKVLESDFKPDWIIALWRGGCPIGMYIQGLLKHYGCLADHIAIRTSSYDQNGEQKPGIDVHGLEYIVKNMKSTDKVLLVDDVFDSGRSLQAVIDKMKRKLRDNYPKSIKIATVFYKSHNNKTSLVPDFFCSDTTDWLVFGHEFEDLTKTEIKNFMGIELPEKQNM